MTVNTWTPGRVIGGVRVVEDPPAVLCNEDSRDEGPIVVDGEGRPVKVWRAQDLIAELGARAGIPEKTSARMPGH